MEISNDFMRYDINKNKWKIMPEINYEGLKKIINSVFRCREYIYVLYWKNIPNSSLQL